MIPRLPPVLLALIGGASVYGIKYALDRFETKAIGPPGSSDYYEKAYAYRRNMKRIGIAGAVSAMIYAGYWVYDARQHRQSPAVMSRNDIEYNQSFHEDQYRERERKYALEREALRTAEKEKEQMLRRHLEKEVLAMEGAVNKSK
ncbi:hypothetical protein A0J61_08585 [Choanephora cucurbitarum]|uniref:Uncharacterized protein n=1 Tax=Choanephora cucurbitarum TaxID=101091 RepID=A0A1C7N2W2_9FUNG|nr:hypothetical protein A0J61_08585 [Choanephora cucurbitarum]